MKIQEIILKSDCDVFHQDDPVLQESGENITIMFKYK